MTRFSSLAAGAVDGLMPCGDFAAAFFGVGLRIEAARFVPLVLQHFNIGPDACAQTCEIACAEHGGFGGLRAHDGDAEHVGLHLHEEIVGGSAAIDAKLVNAQAAGRVGCVGFHGSNDVGNLKCDAFEGGASQVGTGSSASEAEDGATCVRVPVRRAETGEGGHKDDAAAVGNGGGEGFDFGRAVEDAESIAQPLDGSAGDEDAAFERVIGLAGNSPGDGGEQPVG